MQCEVCGRSFESLKPLGNHVRSTHRISTEEYYCSFLRENEKEGVCSGCGSRTKFLDLGSGYRKFCSQKCSANSEETRIKYETSCVKKFGVENPNQSDVVQSKKQRTCFKKYGVDFTFQSKEMQEKKRKTCLEKYGTDNPAKSEVVRQKYGKHV